MRQKLGLLLMEEGDGRMSIQFFAEPEALEDNFAQLKGQRGDAPKRATCICLDYKGPSVKVQARDLPSLDNPQDRPDAYRLGEGPIWFDKEDEDGQKPTSKD